MGRNSEGYLLGIVKKTVSGSTASFQADKRTAKTNP